MIYFRQTIINQIKLASSEREIEQVINDSLYRLKIKNVNGHIVQRFISSMGLALHRETIGKFSTRTLANMNFAMDRFRKLQKPLESHE